MLALRNSNFFRMFDDSLFNDLFKVNDFDVDVKETDTAYVVKAEVPGIKKEDVSITLENNVLAIEFSKQEEKKEKSDNYHLRERKVGRYSRSFQLPTNVDSGSVEASLKDGVLTLEIKKAEAAKRKQIEVKVN